MGKTAVSVTLDRDNLLWLRAQASGAGPRSLSEVLDEIVTGARAAGRVNVAAIRSVAGTIDVNPDDPDLLTADSYMRGQVARSIARPFLVKEEAPPYRPPRKPRRG
jgi:hypothetical protein